MAIKKCLFSTGVHIEVNINNIGSTNVIMNTIRRQLNVYISEQSKLEENVLDSLMVSSWVYFMPVMSVKVVQQINV